MLFRIIIFLSIGLTVLFGSHFFLYYSWIRFFKISQALDRHRILIVLALLSISFFLASFLAHWKDNLFSRYSYFLSGFWLGLLTNLFLASLVLWIIYPFLKDSPALPWVSSTAYFVALLLSIYGSFISFHPQIKDISVEIKNLTDFWKGKRIVQISDVHLGHTYRAAFAQKIADRVNGLDPDIVFITGDLFDGMDGNLSGFVEPLKNLQAPQGILFVTGNHETYLGTAKAFDLIRSAGIKILDDQMIELNGLQIIGYSYPPREEMGGNKKDFSRTIEKMDGFKKGVPTILLHHAPIDIEQAKSMGISLQLSGHTHSGQLFPFNFITRLIYRGYDYGLKTEGDYSIYTTNGVGSWGPPMRTFNRPEIVSIELR